MTATNSEQITIRVDEGHVVSALFQAPNEPRACFVLAHGAGAGMHHPFMARVANGLANRGIATLRYQFPYMERRAKRPDPPALAHATVRAAVAMAGRLAPELPLFAGGKSFGGRMTSQAQALMPLAGVRGLAFLGFPLHAANRPSDERGQHLLGIHIPMLFLQGTRDALADLQLLRALVERLGTRASLRLFAGADHSFHVPSRSKPAKEDVTEELLNALTAWIGSRTPC
ncbi:MAG: dienelactone hydrolase family protein [Acetobacteraceae bacterium]|nr:dienelactone hydrolase family protein [Acetobacteraceae bacterium]